MTILPKKKVPKERNENSSSSSRSHVPSTSGPQVPGSAQYALLSESASTSENSGNLENIINPFSSCPGPSRSQLHSRVSGPSSPTTSQFLASHLNRNKKQKMYSDEEDSDASQDSLRELTVQSRPVNLTQNLNPEEDINSEDERGERNLSAEDWAQKEAAFAGLLKEKRGFIIKGMKEDGACLFRAVADQVLGDQEMHEMVRKQCLDYMEQNEDYFSQYITEDFQRYISRKRSLNAHGNHVEIQAMSEVYNRRVEVYQYDIDPFNVFQCTHPLENAPIRVSYHQKSHYNSVVDPYSATIGIGLGMPNLQPGLAEQRLMAEAVGQSEHDVIEKQMLEDKLLASDWEATDEAIEQQIARESYLEWLKQSDNQRNLQKCHDFEAPSTSGYPPQSSMRNELKQGSPKPTDSINEEQILNQLNHLPPTLFGLSDWDEEDGDVLAQVLAASQAEYLDSLKSQQTKK